MSASLTHKRGGRQPSAATRRMQVVPYLAQKLPLTVIAGLFRVSVSQVRRWSQHADVRAALGEVSAAVVEGTRVQAEELVTTAFAALRDLVTGAEDEHVRLEAAQTVLDRFGYPAVTSSEHSGPGGEPVQAMLLVATAEERLAFASRKKSNER